MAQGNTGWKQREPLTREEWEIHVPIIRQLYLKEQRTLEDVMRIMEEKLGFVATKKVYKTNFNRLRLFKYRTKTSNEAEGAASTPANEVPLSVCTDTWQALLERTSAMAIIPFAGQPAVERPMRPLSSSGTTRCSEVLLWHVTVLSETWLEGRKFSPSTFTRTSTTWGILIGQNVVPMTHFNVGQGVSAVNQACAIVSGVMSQRHSNLLLMMLVEFCCKWSHFPDLRRSLLRYLTKLAAVRLGVQHPLTIILFNLLDENVAALCMNAALQIAAHAEERELPLVEKSALRLKHVHCCMLIDSEQYRAALAPMSWLYNEARKAYGTDGELTRCALLRKGEISIGLGAVQDASSIYEEVLQLSEGKHLRISLDAIGVEAATRLATLRLASGDALGAQQLCKKALKNFWCPFSQRGLEGMGLNLKILLDEILVITETITGFPRQQSGWLTPPSDDQSDDNDCQIPSEEVLAARSLNDCVANEAPLEHSAPCGKDQDPQLEPEAFSNERDNGKDPFVAKYRSIVRQYVNYRSYRPRKPPQGPKPRLFLGM